jgi:hypothetical protein
MYMHTYACHESKCAHFLIYTYLLDNAILQKDTLTPHQHTHPFSPMNVPLSVHMYFHEIRACEKREVPLLAYYFTLVFVLFCFVLLLLSR